MQEKILLVNFPTNGGVQQFSTWLYKEYSEKYGNVSYYQFKAIDELSGICNEYNNIVFCSNNINVYKILRALAGEKGKKIVLINHDFTVRDWANPKEVILHLLYKRYKNKFHKVIVHQELSSHDESGELSLKMPYHDESHKDENKRIKLLQYGRIEKYKNLSFLVDAVVNNDYELIIAGGGRISARLREKISKAPNITLINSYISDDMTNLLFQWCDYVTLVYSSVTQTGLIDMAGRFGKPVIVSNIRGFKEHFDKPYAIVADISSPPSLFSCSVMERHSEYPEMSVCAKKKYEKSKSAWNEYCLAINGFFR
ncbi:hypothetical protein PSC74_05980 [Aeromonas hydrophila]|uniref:glycosyltransferase n=1 Tax=Aeromonas hydrophila TaxID=644 RepID=UPI000FD17F67|nr:glycosyltransferase [Aeromonas hydrophila]AZU48779.1 glycosyl transferases group 1 family protein [Aeromonas hydrophila]QBX70759.1 hypothetical protein E4625_07900 [Aeromonas hydrophila]QBX75484.1 hypothetical protein E4630_07820 [Aeromonas hydrophila]WDA25897.1 hypothetical protein PSC74_05980 [Aeromonas hydrophila]WES91774.1 hypothetical protein PY368_14645 [Aeromonas hydrophila]